MFVFIIARTPLKYRTSLRDELWKLSKQSLLAQTHKDWKAIIVGHTDLSEQQNEHFIALDADEYLKKEKIRLALQYLENNKEIQADYLIRFDDDDVFSPTFLEQITALPERFDCYFDRFHTYVDPVYMKISSKRNPWVANTAIHAYRHAVTRCSDKNLPLLEQDHDQYWYQYYKDKRVYNPSRGEPLYYRILSPFSITGKAVTADQLIDWEKYMTYLRGYGPWTPLPADLRFYAGLKKISGNYFQQRPAKSPLYWMYNLIKRLKNNILES